MTTNLSYDQCLVLKEAGYLQEIGWGDMYYDAESGDLLLSERGIFPPNDCDDNVKCPTDADEFVAWLGQYGYESIDIRISSVGTHPFYIIEADSVEIDDCPHVGKGSSIIHALFDIWEKAGCV